MFEHISFNIPNKYGNFLYKIIENTELTKQIIVFNNLDIIDHDFITSTNLNLNHPYRFSSIKRYILEDQYILFLKITFFSNRFEHGSLKISSLSDFINSSCSTMIFITDSTIVNILTKNELISKQIKNNAVANEFKNIALNKNTLNYNIFDYD